MFRGVVVRCFVPFRVSRPSLLSSQTVRKSTCSSLLSVIFSSGRGFPQLYVFVEAVCLQIMVGQEHVTCLKLLSDFAQQFASLSAADEQSAEIGTKKNDLTEYVASFETYDDIRAGPFRYVTASGKQGQGKDHLLVDREI